MELYSHHELPLFSRHRQFMLQAIKLAGTAYERDEIPVGALIIHENRIIGKGYNQVEQLKDPSAHAEMIALSSACNTLQSKYLTGCTMYVTLEPCPMCASALVWAKLTRLVFATADPRAGAAGSIYNLVNDPRLNHSIDVIQGICEEECEQLLKKFFRNKRSQSP